jgi:2-polyprenyl-3-methyl-5-hydroxy-6-metoxy-1,4-benzoquinol methylase
MPVVSSFDGRAYQARFDALAETGTDVHGEAALVRSFDPTSVLDAGCGTGRVAIELARHGITTVGVDVDDSMIGEARRLAPGLAWAREDLASLELGRQFDVVVLAGNVPLFCPGPSRRALVAACAAHVSRAGRMLAGFELGRGYDLDVYDAACDEAGLVLEDRWSSWGREPSSGDSTYAVSVHRR